jgi:hypothetical protein
MMVMIIFAQPMTAGCKIIEHGHRHHHSHHIVLKANLFFTVVGVTGGSGSKSVVDF